MNKSENYLSSILEPHCNPQLIRHGCYLHSSSWPPIHQLRCDTGRARAHVRVISVTYTRSPQRPASTILLRYRQHRGSTRVRGGSSSFKVTRAPKGDCRGDDGDGGAGRRVMAPSRETCLRTAQPGRAVHHNVYFKHPPPPYIFPSTIRHGERHDRTRTHCGTW